MTDGSKTPGPLDGFKTCYLKSICPFLNFPICLIGSFLSILNILVFTRKTMASPMSTIFLHLSIVELATLLINIPLTWHNCVKENDIHQHQHNWEIFHYLGRCSTSVFYYVSVWLTVMLTIWRYLAIVHPFSERTWCNVKATRNGVIAGYFVGMLLSIPACTSMYVKERVKDVNYTLEYYEDSFPFKLHFILYGTVLKLIPSIILSILSHRLIKTLMEIEGKRVNISRNCVEADQKISNIKQRTDFTTKMLLGILFLFLISEVPSGILGLCSLIEGVVFRKNIFSPTIHVFTTIRLFTFSISFLVYYNLSQQFRHTFKTMIKHDKYQVANQVTRSSDTTLDS